MDRIVDISSDGLYISANRGFLIVTDGNTEMGRIALDDINAVITHAHGLTWSNNIFVRLAERNVPVVICASNHSPVSCLWPLKGHHHQGARMQLQAETSKPLKKQIWQRIVSCKIRMQGAVVASLGREAGAFEAMSKRVRSGDPENLEAQAARRYWPLVMGSEFRRDTDGGGTNAMLNYGYAVLRAMVSRAICAAGLHPTLGVKHSNQANAFALADDLMEPYRPLIDRAVVNLVCEGFDEVTTDVKQRLASIASFDLPGQEVRSPLSVHIGRLAQSVASSLEKREAGLALPLPPKASAIALLGVGQSK